MEEKQIKAQSKELLVSKTYTSDNHFLPSQPPYLHPIHSCLKNILYTKQTICVIENLSYHTHITIF